ncbi:porin family protein [Phaeobacter inhibens]|uniref:outer membrane protein n=1 Tax=Phaeobacter inhibens TaxID=221822 RepID=UPI0021A4297B|nr:porin family protein [Phaeobacter inhibens]UWR66313.1 porin family protein [Phaeobacter inhibens]UWR81863.1 porin family protein [Phaeobacter inhibens]UWR97767.1 porin family protein [Phaeobacter inhibens]
MTRIVSMAAIAAALSTPAFAGNLEEPVVAPAPAAPPVVVANDGGDWTGAYIGGQIGQLDADTSNGLSGDDVSYGVHAGYNYDFGRFVLGGEIDYDATDVDLGGGAATVDSVMRGKVKAGYDFGPVLAYVTGGVAQVDTSVGDETGEFYGIGVAYRLTDQWTVGGEVLEHDFDNLGSSGISADATTVSLRASYQF